MSRILLFGIACVVAFQSAAGQEKKPDPGQVASYIKDLSDNNEQIRVQAAVNLAELGPAAAEATPTLLKMLGEANEDVRLNAAIALGKIGKASIPGLGEKLGSDDADIRFYALSALGWAGPAATAMTPQIIKALADKNEQVRRKAAYALGRVAPDPQTAISSLVASFEDAEADVRTAAAEAISRLGGQAVPALLKALGSDKENVRQQAASALGQIGSAAKEAVQPLKKLMLNPEENPAIFSEALGKIGAAALPALVEAMKSDRAPVRYLAVEALHKIGGEGVPALVDALGEKAADVRRHAAQFLGQMRISDKMVILGLAYSLADDDDQVRFQSIQALQQLMWSAGNTPPPTLKLAVPKLTDALTDLNFTVRQQAFQMLQQLGANPRPKLLEALTSKEDKVRINTASLMVLTGTERQNALPILKEALKHESLELRIQAAHALAQSRLELESVTPILVEGLKSKIPSLRQQSFTGLTNMGQINKVGTQALLGLLEDSTDDNFRQQVLWSLQNTRGDPDLVIPALVKLLKQPGKQTNLFYTAIQVLPMQGPKSIPHLVEFIQGKGDENLKQQAIWALSNVQGDLKDSFKQFEPLLKSNQGNVRMVMMNLLPRLGDQGAEQLLTFLKDPDANVRLTAVQTLRNYGPKYSKQMIPILKEMVKDPNVGVSNQAIWSLSGLGNEAFDFLVEAYKQEKNVSNKQNILNALGQSQNRSKMSGLIQDALKDPEARLRQTAVQCLQYQGPSKDTVAALKIATQDPESSVKFQAIYALANMGGMAHAILDEGFRSAKEPNLKQVYLQSMQNVGYRPKSLLPLLIDNLKETHQQLRITTLQMLSAYGSEAKEAQSAVQELLKDPNPTIRSLAQNVLARLK